MLVNSERCQSGRTSTPGKRVYSKGIEGSNPSLSAERDLDSKRELSPFFIIAKSPVCRAISAIM